MIDGDGIRDVYAKRPVHPSGCWRRGGGSGFWAPGGPLVAQLDRQAPELLVAEIVPRPAD